MSDEIKSITDSLILESKSLQSRGSVPFPSYGSGWGASQIFSSEIAWSDYNDSLLGTGVNNTLLYRQKLGDLSRNSLACAAIRFLGDSIPEAPVQVKKKSGGSSGKKGESKVIANHKMVELWNRPNDYYDDATMLKGIAFSLVLSSNAYLLKNFDDNGLFPIELYWEPHWTIRPHWPIDGSSFISHYEVNRQGQWYSIDRKNVIHIRDGIHPYNQRLGFSGNDSILPELYGDAEAAAYYATLMGGSGIPGFMVSIDKDLKMDQTKLESMEKMIVRKTTGDRKGQPLIAKGARAYKLGFNPRELDLRESRYMAEDRWCAVQGVPAVVLELGSGQAHSIYQNVKMAMERAWRSYVCPKLTMIEKTLTLQLLDDFEDDYQKAGLYVEHDLSQIQALQEDQDAKAKRWGGLVRDGLAMRSEGRSSMNLGPSDPDNEEADKVFYIQSGTQLLKPEEVAAPQPDMGGGFGDFGGGQFDEFGDPIEEFSDTPLLDTAKSFLKGGPGSGPRPGRGAWKPLAAVSAKDSLGNKIKIGDTIEFQNPVDGEWTGKFAEVLGIERKGYAGIFLQTYPSPGVSIHDRHEAKFTRKISQNKSLEFSQAILDLLPNGFLNPSAQWTQFPASMNSLNIPRTSMPQVLSAHRGAMVQFLRGRGISHTKEDVLPTTLTPAQAEYRPDKVEKAKEWEGTQRPILVSKDNYVVDGHHQWMAATNSPEPISIIRLNKEIVPLLLEVARFPSSGVKDENDEEKFWKGFAAIKGGPGSGPQGGRHPKEEYPIHKVSATDYLAEELNNEWSVTHAEDSGPFWPTEGEKNPRYITVRDKEGRLVAGATTIQRGMRTEILAIGSHSQGQGKAILDGIKERNIWLIATASESGKPFFLREGFKEDKASDKSYNISWRNPKKAMPSGEQFVSESDVNDTIKFLKRHRYETAVDLMLAQAAELPTNKKSNGDSLVL